MRTLITTLLSFVIATAISQDWEVGNKWYFSQTVFLQGLSYKTMEISGDTTIQDKPCLMVNGVCSCGSTTAKYLYVDSNQVFRYDEDKENFFILYDFNLNQGDTLILELNFDDSEMKIRIDSTSQIEILGQTRKVQHISYSVDESGMYFGETIIEGIGSTYCFHPQFATCDPATGGLRCYENNNGVHKFITDRECDYTDIIMSTSKDEKQPFTIYPNPVTDEFRIQYESEINVQEIQIYNLKGQLQFEQELHDEFESINIIGLNRGMYIVKFRTDYTEYVTRLIKN